MTSIQIPLYFETLDIIVHNQIHNVDYAAYVMFEDNKIVLHIEKSATPSIVAHEAVHIVNYVFKRCNIKLDIDNDEPYAYLLGWVVEQIHNVLSV